MQRCYGRHFIHVTLTENLFIDFNAWRYFTPRRDVIMINVLITYTAYAIYVFITCTTCAMNVIITFTGSNIIWSVGTRAVKNRPSRQ